MEMVWSVHLQCILIVIVWFVGCGQIVSADTDISLSAPVDQKAVTKISYQMSVRGTMLTPADSGPVSHDLDSQCRFRFDQRQFEDQAAGVNGIRAIRQFIEAKSVTRVGKDHETVTQLPASHRFVHVYGGDTSLIHLSPAVRLTRQQVDLLQLPCDPLTIRGLLPSRTLKDEDEKWNTEDWVVPSMAGIEATATQLARCQIRTVTESEAVIAFHTEATGAITGTATEVVMDGVMTLDRKRGIIRSLKATQREKRSAGTVSPGLDVTAEIEWTQEISENSSSIPDQLPEGSPDQKMLLLTLVTPSRLMMLHSRDWYVFHETVDLVMLRMLKEGKLIGQCNIAPSVRVSPGSSTDVAAFEAEVQAALATRKGKLLNSRVVPDLNGWRILNVSATSLTDTKTILWDYYLCTQKTGEQFSLIFSRTADDEPVFADAPGEILKTLTLRPVPPRIQVPK